MPASASLSVGQPGAAINCRPCRQPPSLAITRPCPSQHNRLLCPPMMASQKDNQESNTPQNDLPPPEQKLTTWQYGKTSQDPSLVILFLASMFLVPVGLVLITLIPTS